MTALQTQLDRHLAAIDGMDQKAALLPPALGLVGVLGVVTSGATGWMNRPDFDGDSNAWRIMESWQNRAAARSSAGIRPS